MKTLKIALCLLVGSIAVVNAQSFDRSVFYLAYVDGSLFSTDNIINMIYDSTFREKEAYVGAVLMKKAGIVTNPTDKLLLFKQGREKLEHAINIDPSNPEYRFLRITIQENAASTFDYNKNMDEDAQIVRARYGTMPAEVREAVAYYSLKSKVLGTMALK